MADELIDILYENGISSGEIKLKSEAHKIGLWHASTHVWIYTPEGKILIQKRTPNKDTYPNLWDISVAGHLSAGDTPITASVREVEEEIGLVISAEALHYLKTNKNSKQPNSNIIDNEFNNIFICCASFKENDLKLQADEVAEIRLLSVSDLEKELKTNYSKYVPHGKEYYEFILKNISSALSTLNKA